MPELPDIAVYIEALESRVVGQPVERIRVNSPSLVRTFEPSLEVAKGKKVREIRRLGKRIALGLEDELWLMLHLMIACRLHWKPHRAKLSGRYQFASFDFTDGTLMLTEAGTNRRASLHLIWGEDMLRLRDLGGLESSPRLSSNSWRRSVCATTPSSGR